VEIKRQLDAIEVLLQILLLAQYVSGTIMPIIRSSRVQYAGGERTESALHPHTVRLLTEGDDTRGCGDTIGPPDDEKRAARNMFRSVVEHMYC